MTGGATRRGRGDPAPAGRTGRGAARRPVDGDRGAGRRPAAGAGRAAHRLGQVGGLLRRHRAAARAGRRADGDRLAAAGADAQPDRRRPSGPASAPRTINSTNIEDWDEIHDAVRRRRGRRAAGQPGAAQQPRLPRRGAARSWPRPPACWWSTRRTASPTGATTSGPTTGGIRTLLADLPAGIPVLATTATANARVTADVAEQLGVGGGDTLVLRGALDRESLRLAVVTAADPAQRLAWLAEHLDELPGSGHRLHAHRRGRPHEVADSCARGATRSRPTPGRPRPPSGEQLEEDLLANRVKALVATRALGMGFDKPDLGFVVHLGRAAVADRLLPAGRPRRPRRRAAPRWCCCRRRGPRHLALLRLAGVPARGAGPAASLRALADAGPAAVDRRRWRPRVDLRRTRLEMMLKVLDVDGAVRRVRGGWTATGAAVGLRRRALRAGRRGPRAPSSRRCCDYLAHRPAAGWSSCAAQLDDPGAAPCGRCDNCAGHAGSPPTVADDGARRGPRSACGRPGRRDRAAQDVADRRWPRSASPLTGKIAAGEQAEPGRAVGPAVRPRLGRPAARPARPGARPTGRCPTTWSARWSRCWPSLGDWAQRPVGGGRARLADAGRGWSARSRADWPRSGGCSSSASWTASAAGRRAPRREQQRPAAGRGARRLRRAPGRGRALRGLAGPVLLVDDLVDSGWTMTVAARLLRQAGAPAVLPLALALEAC